QLTVSPLQSTVSPSTVSPSTGSSPISPASSSLPTFSPPTISLTIPILPRPSNLSTLQHLNAHPMLTRAKLKHLTSQSQCLVATTSPASPTTEPTSVTEELKSPAWLDAM
ncbi:hypothetical protein U1Q18_007427, partial [Sarracenia purpurea var. burkii]